MTTETTTEQTTEVVAKELQERHLAVGATMTTLCGLTRGDKLQTTHPSKARKTDCLACREAYRGGKTAEPREEPFKVGDYVEYPDGSAWEVLDKTKSSAKVKCVVPGSFHPKGQVTNISNGAAFRVFTTEEFVALVKRQEVPAVNSGEPAKPKSTGKWAPTAADVAKVKELRAAGNSYIAIETAMGWPDGHGNRPWRIVTGKLLAREVAK